MTLTISELPDDIRELLVKNFLSPKARAYLSATCRLFHNNCSIQTDVVQNPLFIGLKPARYLEQDFLILLRQLNVENLPWQVFLTQLEASRASLPIYSTLLDFTKALYAAVDQQDYCRLFLLLRQREFNFNSCHVSCALPVECQRLQLENDITQYPLEKAVSQGDLLAAKLFIMASNSNKTTEPPKETYCNIIATDDEIIELSEVDTSSATTADPMICIAARRSDAPMCKLLLQYDASVGLETALMLAKHSTTAGSAECEKLISERLKKLPSRSTTPYFGCNLS